MKTYKQFHEAIVPFLLKTAAVAGGGYLLKKAGDAAYNKINNTLDNLRDNSGIGGNKRVEDTRKKSNDPNVGNKIYYGDKNKKP